MNTLKAIAAFSISLAVAATMTMIPTTAASISEPEDLISPLVKVDIATAGTGSRNYRIPALTVTNKGTIIAAYDARPGGVDLPAFIKAVVRRSTDGGRTWTAQKVVRGAAQKGFGDQSLLVDRKTGRIFNFYAASVNQGYVGSTTSTDPNDPNVLQADYSYSDDDGITWKHRRITKQIKTHASWGGLFASSGQGIQLRTGRYAGRLLQQYAIRISGQNYAASAFSDDHGATWRMGKLVGPGMDENKTVELANGVVMLDVRDSPHRLQAYSYNGGLSYTVPKPNTDLVDPAVNGSVIRFAPNAPASDPRSHWLLHSIIDNPLARQHLVIKLSCDDGKTWPVTRVVEQGLAGYSTLTNLRNGRFGLLYERGIIETQGNYYKHITYTSFGPEWLTDPATPLDRVCG